MDPITLLVGGGIALGGVVLGRLGRTPRTRKAPRPICSCGHGFGFHDGGNLCHATRERYDVLEGVVGNPCTCRYYDGPEPLPRSWVPPKELTE